MAVKNQHLTYAQVADRVEQALGVRPALSTLRSAGVDQGRGTMRTRVTAGMPDPLGKPDAAGRTVFSAKAIDRWLANHPRQRIRIEQERLRAAALATQQQAVDRARELGLSWQQIAEAFVAPDGRTFTRQWAQQRFGRN